MLFLLPIPVALGCALIWAWWVSRPQPPVDPSHSVAQWSRAVDALATSTGRGGRARRR